MQILSAILLTLFFPLNSLLFFQSGGVQGSENKKEDQMQEVLLQGEVKGTEKYREESITTPIVPVVQFQPTRKEGVRDLTVVNAHASLVLDVDSGTILHYNNGKEQRQIASLTKVMTAVLVMEEIANLDELITVDEEAVYVEGTKIGCPRSGYCISQRLKVGEKISARNLLKAMLMNSANDAAVALGKHIAGSQEQFAELMNKKAKEMGLTDSHFCTPSGLEPDGREKECYSSAYDIARIAAYATKYDLIWEIFRLPNNTEITSADGKLVHTILNTDLALDQVPNVVGGKTGFTPLAGYSLLMVVSDQSRKHKIVAVLLDDSTRWQDIRSMLDWTFQSYAWK